MAAATALSSATSSSARVKATTSCAPAHSWITAAASWPSAPTTTIRTSVSGDRPIDSGRHLFSLLERAHLRIVEHALPAGDNGGGDAVAHDVHRRASHVHHLVDSQQDGGAFERQAELREGGGEHHERGA